MACGLAILATPAVVAGLAKWRLSNRASSVTFRAGSKGDPLTMTRLEISLLLALSSLITVSVVSVLLMTRRPFDSGRRWKHGSPSGNCSPLRINTLLNASGSKSWQEGSEITVMKDGQRFFMDGPLAYTESDWTMYGEGVVTSQRIDGDHTFLTFRVTWRYPWWLRLVNTWANSSSQRRAQGWALHERPDMFQPL